MSNCAPVSAPVSHLPARLQLDATRLAREVFGNEVQAQIHDQSLWCYRQLKEDAAKEKLFAVCETNDGEIDRLLGVNGQELNPEQRQAEDQRIQKMLDDPDQMRRSEEHTSELQSRLHLVCRLLLEKKKTNIINSPIRS